MNLLLLQVGKTSEKYLVEGISIYEKRIQHYIDLKTIVIPAIKNTKNMSINEIKDKEGEEMLKFFNKSDYIVLLDEKGFSYNSIDFANSIQKKMNSGIKNLMFVIGGAYGFSEKVYLKANEKIALSCLTFSHQIVRLIFAEQLYRAFTILKNEPYHNE